MRIFPIQRQTPIKTEIHAPRSHKRDAVLPQCISTNQLIISNVLTYRYFGPHSAHNSIQRTAVCEAKPMNRGKFEKIELAVHRFACTRSLAYAQANKYN